MRTLAYTCVMFMKQLHENVGLYVCYVYGATA